MKPSRALLALLAALLSAAILLGALPALGLPLPASLTPLWWGLLLTLLLVAGCDALWLHRLPSPRLQRSLPGNLPLGRWSDVQLRIEHDYSQVMHLELFDHLPAAMACEQLPLHIELQPQRHTECSYRVRPLQRGHFHFPRCELLLPSPLGLWRGRRLLELPGETRVVTIRAPLSAAMPLISSQ